ncbi:MAG: DNA gyrase subunit A [Anaerolineae bacterium]|nr:DNA gyrase subunit A [Anaerolineae bacterium]
MEIGIIQPVDIDEQMRASYIDYAMSVIVARALPDARDGLKPVHRRILYAMHDMGVHANAGYKKSARIVGEVLGKYHPHGDMAVYDAMARMAQDFSMRYPLVDGQGNFGSIDGDAPAAMRYTEARMSALAEEMLVDIDKNTVDFVDNFDATLQEPTVLPSRLPNLLLNGASGIAVGMATNIPPHNLKELADAIAYLIDNYDNTDDIAVKDLMQFIKGPDFPTRGVLIGLEEDLYQAYSNGHGRLTVRGVAHIEQLSGKKKSNRKVEQTEESNEEESEDQTGKKGGGRYAIIISEIPYQVNKSGLIERIAELVREGRLEEIADLRDESDRNGMSIVIELRRGVQPKQVLNKLYKYTPLQTTYGMHLLALVDGEPKTISLKRALQIFIDHRCQIIKRRSEFDLEKARRRMHILEGLLIALANLDEVIQTIRQSPDAEQARQRLIKRFNLTEVQAQAILDLQLRRLAALEREKIEAEYREVKQQIAYLEDLLAHPKKILETVKNETNELAEKYGDKRRTRILRQAVEEFDVEDLVADEPILINITEKGYVKRVPESSIRAITRGRRGKSGQDIREEDEILMMIPARTLDTILFFSDRGKVYSEKAYQIPETTRGDHGTSIANILSLNSDERITAAVAVPDFQQAKYITLATVHGRLKRMGLSDFSSVRSSGLIITHLEEGDELGWARLTSGQDEIIIVTALGQALRISEKELRPMGRQAGGVAGIRLQKGDTITSMEVVEPGGYLMIITENGYGKRTPLSEYPLKRRATGGVVTLHSKYIQSTGKIAASRVVQENDEVTLITSGGMVLRLKVKTVPSLGRSTRGMHLMDVSEGDKVASLARIFASSETETANKNGYTSER